MVILIQGTSDLGLGIGFYVNANGQCQWHSQLQLHVDVAFANANDSIYFVLAAAHVGLVLVIRDAFLLVAECICTEKEHGIKVILHADDLETRTFVCLERHISSV